MRMKHKGKLLTTFLMLCIYSGATSQNNFIAPFKVGSYFEYKFIEPGSVFRYSARIVSDTIFNGRIYSRMDVYNEPPFNIHTIHFSFDTLTRKIYGGEGASCPDSAGNKLAVGFDLPVGYTWNDCSMGAYFRSTINENAHYSGFFGTTDTLHYVERKDTVGVPIEGTTFYRYVEKFGYIAFYRGYGSPLQGGPYAKEMVGAVIDGVTYGSILLDINKISNEIPSKFKLEQNYPNPFNPSTIIRFSITKSSFVNLKVYNQLGKEISILVNEKKSRGSYQFVFNSANLSSGTYYYTLQAEDFIETKRMILVK